mmetsp:Transcript_150691/g.464992  ORF Transcript_150691/g.464992 Transcript_150691/m.464992 type:complete len:94 (-) Transcript_150691:72-353(-)
MSSYGISMVPGGCFSTPEGASDFPRRFFRVSFSLLDEETADTAMQRLRTFLEALRPGARKRPSDAIEEDRVQGSAQPEAGPGPAKAPRTASSG